jgi:hypothetical protein
MCRYDPDTLLAASEPEEAGVRHVPHAIEELEVTSCNRKAKLSRQLSQTCESKWLEATPQTARQFYV